MIIKSIKLTNFRNHTTYSLACQKDTTLILGKNGWGKTSVLEAIYILTRGKSFRATDAEIMRRGSEYYRIELEYSSGEKTIATYDGKTKTFLAEAKKTRRLPKKHQYPSVLFLPSDLNLISHAPSRRRDYFDRIFSQLSPTYQVALSKYNKALKQRNELLKNDYLRPDALFSWNLLLAKYGSELYLSRQKLTKEINDRLTTIYQSIAKNEDEVFIKYKSEVTTPDAYIKTLESSFNKDTYLGHTSFGVHHDDYIFEFNHETADGSASRGETRSIVLALKFIEADLIFQKLGQKPLVLLDDVFSELDETRRKCLIENFKDNQVIITSVENIR